jgi:two-component system cell cycle sensor histidine kinase/response regulator CckA
MILAESPKDQGTTFTIYLKASRHALLEKEQRPVQATQRGKGKIMVMDDEEMIRDVSQALLSRLGYQVVLAADGHEAIKLYKNNTTSQERIDAIIMDLTIPGGMGGKEAVKEILQINPSAKVIVSSGYSNDPVMANHKEYGFCAALDKPYQLKSLVEILDQVLT